MSEQPEHAIVLPNDEFDRLVEWLNDPAPEPSPKLVEMVRRVRMGRGEQP
jgi:uncharacterized protein (DUF1778 family)